MKNKINQIFLFLILIIAFVLRIFGINWDQGQHLHPDERFLTMVISDIKLPQNIFNYFDSQHSPLNPANQNYDFYAYGTLPLLIVRILGNLFSLNSYDYIFLVGRVVSAVFDTGTILILYFLSRFLKLKTKTTILICFFYALAVLPIQLSHFFTVDTFTVFFSTLTIFLFIKFIKKNHFRLLFLSALFFGISLSCKISLIISLPLFLLFLFFKSTKLKRIILPLSFLLVTCLSFRVFQPYAFNSLFGLSQGFINSINTANQMITGQYQYPPNIQWYSTIPLIHPFITIFFFGLGPVLTFLFLKGIKKSSHYHFIFFFILLIFCYQGIQLAKYMRYFYPIYPFLILFAGVGFESISNLFLKKFLIILIIFNAFIFLNIYLQIHPRVQASQWICQNISSQSSLTYEYWDDSLPLDLSSKCNSQNFNLIKLDVADPDTAAKWKLLNQNLQKSDYIIFSSSRFWKSITDNSSMFPSMSSFYKDLFNNQLSFKQIKSFYSYPGVYLPFFKKCILIGSNGYPGLKTSFIQIDSNCSYPGIYFRDNLAEESFTVYDHPQVIIFSRQ